MACNGIALLFISTVLCWIKKNCNENLHHFWTSGCYVSIFTHFANTPLTFMHSTPNNIYPYSTPTTSNAKKRMCGASPPLPQNTTGLRLKLEHLFFGFYFNIWIALQTQRISFQFSHKNFSRKQKKNACISLWAGGLLQRIDYVCTSATL